MADPYWRYSDPRQQQQQQQQQQVPIPQRHQQPPIPPLSAKRPRSDYGGPGGQELPNYFGRDDERGPHRARDTDNIGASYDNYLRNVRLPSFGGGDSAARPMSGRPAGDPRMVGIMGPEPAMGGKGRSMGIGGGRPELSLPHDASNTLFVEGLPLNCSRREVAHIFRPFVGYKEVRLVTKEPRHSGDDPLVLCFVDFVSPAHAATAMDALQGALKECNSLLLPAMNRSMESNVMIPIAYFDVLNKVAIKYHLPQPIYKFTIEYVNFHSCVIIKPFPNPDDSITFWGYGNSIKRPKGYGRKEGN